MRKHVNIITVILSLVTLFMGITCMICLPEQVAVSFDDAGDITMVISRFSAVAVGVVLGMAGILIGFFLATTERSKKHKFTEQTRSIIYICRLVLSVAISLAGVAVMVVFLIMNS